MGTEPQIRRDFVETGQIKLVFSPILDQGSSLRLSEAAYCAGDQGRFWEMHDLLFESQDQLWTGSLEIIQDLATEIGLDLDTFNACMEKQTHTQTIQQQHTNARSNGIRIRPSFRILDRRIEGALPYNQFQIILTEVISAEKSP